MIISQVTPQESDVFAGLQALNGLNAKYQSDFSLDVFISWKP